MNLATASAVPAAPDPIPVAASPAMAALVRTLEEVAPAGTTVLLLGTRGSGRVRLARHLHRLSGRSGPCLEIRCDSSTEASLEAIGAAIASAAGGTVILREVGALGAAAQASLVRALAERPQEPARSARIVATAEPELPLRVRAGAFRSDLYYRLDVFPVAVPPLAERLEDLPGLAASVLEEWADAGGARRSLSDEALAALRARPPATVAALADLLRAARGAGPSIAAAELFDSPPEAEFTFPECLPLDLGQLERLAIEEALRRVGGNRTQAARLLHIGLRTLRSKLRTWRMSGDEVAEAAAPRNRPTAPASPGPGSARTAANLARAWARRSHERSA